MSSRLCAYEPPPTPSPLLWGKEAGRAEFSSSRLEDEAPNMKLSCPRPHSRENPGGRNAAQSRAVFLHLRTSRPPPSPTPSSSYATLHTSLPLPWTSGSFWTEGKQHAAEATLLGPHLSQGLGLQVGLLGGLWPGCSLKADLREGVASKFGQIKIWRTSTAGD